jgi:ADP-dependent NAD(P)H-hydrate dehydratase / NAD(P)H-hydrate epimerase
MEGLAKIFSHKKLSELDSAIIECDRIASWDLMERAARAIVNELKKNINITNKIAVICGPGNNGGDGLALSRMLLKQNYDVNPFLINFKNKLSSDTIINSGLVEKKEINELTQFPDLESYEVIIDSIFGTGLSREVKGDFKSIIERINKIKTKVISIDIPSGMLPDVNSSNWIAVESDLCITINSPKRSFFYPENNKYLQKWVTVNIGAGSKITDAIESSNYIIDSNIKTFIKKRNKYSNKGHYGTALIVAGSKGMIGAAVLSAKACLRSGVGKLSMAIPEYSYNTMHVSVPEATCINLNTQTILNMKPEELNKYSSIGIGPGLGVNENTYKIIEYIFENYHNYIVIDADAINTLAQYPEVHRKITSKSILTPHIKEFDRLVGKSISSEERFKKLKKYCLKNNCIVVLKDAYTCVCCNNGSLYFNTSGNPGMATAGSGDALTGVITGLVAQGYSNLRSALIGTYFHGLAGDKARDDSCENSVIASDIINNLKISQQC